MVIDVNCKTCVHKPVCKHMDTMAELQERLDEAFSEQPNNLRYEVEWECVYRKDINYDNRQF